MSKNSTYKDTAFKLLEADRLNQGKSKKEYYGSDKKSKRHTLFGCLAVIVVLAIIVLLMLWSKLHIIWIWH